MAPEYRKIKGVPRKEALSMSEMVPLFVKSRGLTAGLNTRRVFEAWDEVSGAKTFTLNKFYKGGKLYVTLSSSMVRSHLEFQREEILKAVNAHLEKDPLFDKDCPQAGLVKEIVLK